MSARTLLFVAACAVGTAASAQHDHAAGGGDPAAALVPASQAGTGSQGVERPMWTALPVIVAQGGRGEVALRANSIDATFVSVFAPEGDAARQPAETALADGMAQVRSHAPGRGNYHWVQAREDRSDAVRIASTVWYFSAPGASPTAMLAAPKCELEIVPSPLPREHGHYRESEKWRFVVRWQGRPLPDQALTLETENGSRSTVRTDDAGVAVVLFPRDFRPAGGGGHGGHGRERAGFVLATSLADGGKDYLTAFNHVYSPEPERTRSLGWGAAFGLLGMLVAAPLLRRKESNNA